MSKQAKGVVINRDGTYQEKVFKHLSDYQDSVGGYIEGITLLNGETDELANAYVNEEGKFKGLPINYIATEIARNGNAIYIDDLIVGNMIIVGASDKDGYDTNIPSWIMDIVKNKCKLLEVVSESV